MIFVAFLIGNVILFLVLNSFVVSTQAAPETIKSMVSFRIPVPKPPPLPPEILVDEQINAGLKDIPNMGEEDIIRLAVFTYFVIQSEKSVPHKLLFLDDSGNDPSLGIMKQFDSDPLVEKKSMSISDWNGVLHKITGERGEVLSIGAIHWNSDIEVSISIRDYNRQLDRYHCTLKRENGRWQLKRIEQILRLTWQGNIDKYLMF